MRSGDKEILLGKVIVSIALNAARDILQIGTSCGAVLHYLASAECCSESWIEHVSGVREVLKSEASVASVVEIPMGEVPGGPSNENRDNFGNDYLQFYEVTLGLTDGQRLTIEYRNESNGHYGGDLELIRKVPLEDLRTLRSIAEDL